MQTVGGIEVSACVEKRAAACADMQMRAKTFSLNEWEEYLNSVNPELMEPGLDRIRIVAERLKIFDSIKKSSPLIIQVAGTNGKGSVCAFLSSVFNRLSLKAGLYTSPHLLRFTERICIEDREVEEGLLCQALYDVVSAQGKAGEQGSNTYIDLSYFELVTLASFLCFLRSDCKVWVLETGLGGRFDAVSVLNHDIAVITSVGLDHMKILGDTVQQIAYEKAGIIHEGDLVVVGAGMDEDAFREIRLAAKVRKAAAVFGEGADFECRLKGNQAQYTDLLSDFSFTLPVPAIPFSCAAPALKVLQLAAEKLGVVFDDSVKAAVHYTAEHTSLPGRMQKVASDPDIILDVAHNLPAAVHLISQLNDLRKRNNKRGRLLSVTGMLKDKDIEGVMNVLAGHFDEFFAATLHTLRGENAERLKNALALCKKPVSCFDNVEQALSAALAKASAEDMIIVTGSFVTVAEAYKVLRNNTDQLE